MAGDQYDERFEQLEALIVKMQGELHNKQGDIDRLISSELDQLKPTSQAQRHDNDTMVSPAEVRQIVEEIGEEQAAQSPLARFSLGGYGEMHANFSQGEDSDGNSNDQFDLHRLVAYVGYDFNDWIKFASEFEKVTYNL